MQSERAQLLELLRKDAYRAGTFTLASGKTSDFFIDCKRVVLTAKGHALIGAAFFDALRIWQTNTKTTVQAIAGVALGGCPLASAVSLVSYQKGEPLDALYVRKEAKDHGTKKLIEGTVPNGATVVLLEDVLTTGGSSLAAVEHLRNAGFVVPLVLALVDRKEGASSAFAEKNVGYQTLFTRDDFVG